MSNEDIREDDGPEIPAEVLARALKLPLGDYEDSYDG